MQESTETQTGAGAAREPADALDLLLAQHREVKALFRQIRAAAGKERKALVNAACDKLILHAELEERVFYPAMKKIDPGQIAHSLEEHAEAEALIASLSDLSYLSPGFDAKVTALLERVEHHVEEEEETVIPEARRRLNNLDDLGEEMVEEMPRIDPAHIRNEWQESGRFH